MPRVVIVGGGISGLATAYALEARRSAFSSNDPLEIVVLERAHALGGNLRTVHRDGLLIDEAADSWVAAKPHATDLARALGLGDRLVETRPENRRVYIATEPSLRSRVRGRVGAAFGVPRRVVDLVPMPQGLVLGIPTRIVPLATTRLLGVRGKARVALDCVLPNGFGRDPGRAADDDESVAAFITRRLGAEALDRLAGPLLGGLFTGDVDALSLHATFPQLAALEAHGGLIRGARRLQAARATRTAPSAFVGLRGGMGDLVGALGRRLAATVQTGASVVGVTRTADGSGQRAYQLEVCGDRGERRALAADALVLTGPAHVAASLVRAIDGDVAETLAAIPYGSSSTVFCAFARGDVPHALDATGYLVPRSLGRAALASTWVTSKWAERAPEGVVLLRVFFGGDDAARDDDALVALARNELRDTLAIEALPRFTHVGRFLRASPQPRVGHPARMRALRVALERHRGLHLAGSAYDGVGISDCVRQGEQIAEAIARAR